MVTIPDVRMREFRYQQIVHRRLAKNSVRLALSFWFKMSTLEHKQSEVELFIKRINLIVSRGLVSTGLFLELS